MLGSGSGGTKLFIRERVRWQFFLLLAGTVLTLLFGQAGSALAFSFNDTGSMGVERQDHTATLLDDGTVLITGGLSTSNGILDSAKTYDPSTGIFSDSSGPMKGGARRLHTATILTQGPNAGKVLITGGISTGNTVLASAELYDPSTRTFALTGSMNSGRQLHTATLLPQSGKVLITGGRSGTSGNSALNTAEIYDPATETFTLVTGTNSTMSDKRAFHTATLLDDGRVLVTGGIPSSSAGATNKSADIYDPTLGTLGQFIRTGDMHVARNYHAAVLLKSPDHRVLITGGTSGSNGPSLSTAELYDPDQGTFGVQTVDMKSTHTRHTATLLSDGTVLVAGDYNTLFTPPPGQFLVGDSAWVFKPEDGDVFESRGSMRTNNLFPSPNGRSFYSAVLLNNGTVLLAGGITNNPDGTVTQTPTAELYDPSAVTVTPAGHTFPDTATNVTSAPQTFTINTNADLAIGSFSITGTNSDMFAVSDTTCTTQTLPVPEINPPPPSLVGGGSCTVSVTFTPKSPAGAKSATLLIPTNDLAIPTWSIPLSGTGVNVNYTLTVNIATTTSGTGSVYSSSNQVSPPPTEISCSGGNGTSCQSTYINGTQVTLSPSVDANNLFSSWTGPCTLSGTDCIVTMDAAKSVTGNFTYAKPARVVGSLDYDMLMDAYNNAVSGHYAEIRAREFTFTDISPVFDGGSSSITITGGYDKTFSTNSGYYSVVKGMTIKSGTLVLSNLIID